MIYLLLFSLNSYPKKKYENYEPKFINLYFKILKNTKEENFKWLIIVKFLKFYFLSHKYFFVLDYILTNCYSLHLEIIIFIIIDHIFAQKLSASI